MDGDNEIQIQAWARPSERQAPDSGSLLPWPIIQSMRRRVRSPQSEKEKTWLLSVVVRERQGSPTTKPFKPCDRLAQAQALV